MNETAAPAPPAKPQGLSPEARGYLFWGTTAFAILVTELLGVGEVQEKIHMTIPWPTISTTVGHLGERWGIVYAVVVGVIAAVAFHALAIRNPGEETQYGRAKSPEKPKPEPFPFYSWQISILPAIAAGFLAWKLFPDNKDRWGYLIYGTFLVYGVLLPSAFIFLFKREAQFPTLFFTFRSLRERRRLWRWIAPGLIAGLAVLVFHLALYPWPTITNEPSEYAGLKARKARSKAEEAIRGAGGGSQLAYSAQIKGIDSGHNAWLVYFSPRRGSNVEAGCVVVVTEGSVSAKPPCPTVTRPGR